MSSVCNILTNQQLFPYGDDSIAMMGIVLKIIMLGTLILTGFAFGGAPVIGYFYGARKKDKLNELFKYCYKTILIITEILTLSLFILSPTVVKIFIEDTLLLSKATLMLRLQVICLPFVAIVLMSTIFCQAFGKIGGSFILSLSRQGFVFIVCIFILSMIFKYNGIISCQFVSDIISCIIASIIIKKVIYKEIHAL